MLTAPARTCPVCHRPMPRRRGESPYHYRRRNTCSHSCAATARNAKLRRGRTPVALLARGQVRAAILALATDLTSVTVDDVADELMVPERIAREALTALAKSGALTECRDGEGHRTWRLEDRRAA